jgi:hypothetical protein
MRTRQKLGSGLVAVVLLVLTALACAGQANASASRFVYELCDPALPGGGNPSASFTVNPGVPLTPFDTCAQPGGSIGITETGAAAATFAFWSIAVPATPGGFVESETISAIAYGLGPGNDHTFVFEQGWPANGFGENKRAFPLHTSYNPFSSGGGFVILMNCDGNYGPGCGAGPTVAAHYIAVTEVDPKPPSIGGIEGSLLGGGVLRGHQTLAAEGTDVGGGVSRMEVLVNGLPAGAAQLANCGLVLVKNPSYEGPVAISPSPCPAKLKGAWTLDTAAPPFQRGANSVQVCTGDYSSLGEGNRTCSAATPAEVDDSCVESPVAGGEVLSAQFAATHTEEVTVPYRHTAKVVGELADNAGDPISGATICVETHTQGTRRGLRPVATARTDAQGHFVYKVAPGPNRKLLLAYRHDSFQVGRAIRYYAHARPRIELSRGRVERGGEIRIRGELPGHRAGGRVVVLQASALHSKRWLTFDRATTNADGVFHARYRFDATTRPITYRIRALVPRQRGYPWESGHSSPALVEVRG